MLSYREKTPRVCALGVFLCLLGSGALACPAPESMPRETAQLAHIHDGDSLRLSDDRRIRLLGINAPEVAWDGEPAEPLANQARDRLRGLLKPGDALQLVYDTERKDRYGRTLAHVYTEEGMSLEGLLLRRGLAFHIAVPPNLALADCLAQLEQGAREAGAGLWQENVWPAKAAANLSPADSGYQRVSGRVQDVSRSGGQLWLELDGPLVLRVTRSDLAYFPEDFAQRAQSQWLGRRVEVHGWVIDRSGSGAVERGYQPLMLLLRSPHAVRLLSD